METTLTGLRFPGPCPCSFWGVGCRGRPVKTSVFLTFKHSGLSSNSITVMSFTAYAINAAGLNFYSHNDSIGLDHDAAYGAGTYWYARNTKTTATDLSGGLVWDFYVNATLADSFPVASGNSLVNLSIVVDGVNNVVYGLYGTPRRRQRSRCTIPGLRVSTRSSSISTRRRRLMQGLLEYMSITSKFPSRSRGLCCCLASASLVLGGTSSGSIIERRATFQLL